MQPVMPSAINGYLSPGQAHDLQRCERVAGILDQINRHCLAQQKQGCWILGAAPDSDSTKGIWEFDQDKYRWGT